MSSKDSKTKEERLIEMFLKDYIDESTFMQMLRRIKKKNKE